MKHTNYTMTANRRGELRSPWAQQAAPLPRRLDATITALHGRRGRGAACCALAGAVAAGALLVPSARAAIFASDMIASGSGTAYTLHFRLNEAANAGSIVIASVANPGTALATVPLSGGQLAKGPHDVAFSSGSLAAGNYVFRVQVSAAPHTAYDLLTPISPIATGATVSYGLKVNRVAGTLGYGHIYMADYQSHTAAAHPVHEFASDGTFIQNITPPRATANITTAAAIGTDGALYVSDQDTDSLLRYTAGGLPAAPTWTLDKTFTGPVADNTKTPVVGSLATRAFQVFGTGDAAMAYLTDYAIAPNQVETATLSDTAAPTESVFDAVNLSNGRVDQITVSPDQKVAYISGSLGMGEGRHLNRWIYGLNPADSANEWYLDPFFSENDTTKSILTGACRGIGVLETNPALVWATQTGGAGSASDQNFIAKITLNSLPANADLGHSGLLFASGIQQANSGTATNLDRTGDGRISLVDAELLLRSPSPVQGTIAKVPLPAGAALPVTLDLDPKGNLVVGANANPNGDPTAAGVFFVLAVPDAGSQDNAVSPGFHIG